ncbi:MAG: LPXTG cell wall anchor domain-containing protein [Defluviitaleaceae bacterium]|nr:LPXTG cell wall anchor domain-containing protein [Defluviitaleaceae bacterium]
MAGQKLIKRILAVALTAVLIVCMSANVSAAGFFDSFLRFFGHNQDPVWDSSDGTVRVYGMDLFGEKTKNLLPGDSVDLTIELRNDSAAETTFLMRAEPVTGSDAQAVAAEFDGKTALDYVLDIVGIDVSYDGALIYSGTLRGDGTDLYGPDGVTLGSIAAGASKIIGVTIKIPIEAGNELQDALCAVKWEFTAQTECPPPSGSTSPSPSISVSPSPSVSVSPSPSGSVSPSPSGSISPSPSISISPSPSGPISPSPPGSTSPSPSMSIAPSPSFSRRPPPDYSHNPPPPAYSSPPPQYSGTPAVSPSQNTIPPYSTSSPPPASAAAPEPTPAPTQTPAPTANLPGSSTQAAGFTLEPPNTPAAPEHEKPDLVVEAPPKLPQTGRLVTNAGPLAAALAVTAFVFGITFLAKPRKRDKNIDK